MRKSELRQEYLSKQTAISEEDRIAKSRSISELFFAKFDLGRVTHLHSFIPIARFNEVDTYLILQTLWQKFPNIVTVVPRVDFGTNQITNLKFDRGSLLVRNVWDIDEPSHNEYVDAEIIDLVLVPGLCFDRAGHRVGYGKGFYDRFLMTCRPDCVKVGLTYFEPVDVIDDVHDGDVLVDFVVRPDRGSRSFRLE